MNLVSKSRKGLGIGFKVIFFLALACEGYLFATTVLPAFLSWLFSLMLSSQSATYYLSLLPMELAEDGSIILALWFLSAIFVTMVLSILHCMFYRKVWRMASNLVSVMTKSGSESPKFTK